MGEAKKLSRRALPDGSAVAWCGCLQSIQGLLQGSEAAIDFVPPVYSPPCVHDCPRCPATPQMNPTAPAGALNVRFMQEMRTRLRERKCHSDTNYYDWTERKSAFVYTLMPFCAFVPCVAILPVFCWNSFCHVLCAHHVVCYFMLLLKPAFCGPTLNQLIVVARCGSQSINLASKLANVSCQMKSQGCTDQATICRLIEM